ncbi:MAG: hypothetical protein LBL69_05605 [Zoogloeaceae bacterium]|jgi:hypothetical protein|nr:hypothetical protein [Zoogloeaceae bacterium]
MALIDDALVSVSQLAARETTGAGRSGNAPRRAAEACHALVGMRLSLFPGLAGQAPQAIEGTKA